MICFSGFCLSIVTLAVEIEQVNSEEDAESLQLDCAPSAMSKCTDPLKIVTDNKDLGFATSKEELFKMCP